MYFRNFCPKLGHGFQTLSGSPITKYWSSTVPGVEDPQKPTLSGGAFLSDPYKGVTLPPRPPPPSGQGLNQINALYLTYNHRQKCWESCLFYLFFSFLPPPLAQCLSKR